MKKLSFTIISILTLAFISCGQEKKETRFPDGSIKERFEYSVDENGSELKNGEYTQFYPNGQVRTKGIYENNLSTGLWKKWDKKGNLIKEYTAKEGNYHGEEISYNSKGDTIKKNTYDEGILTYLLEYDEEGKLIKDIKLEEGHNKSILGKWKIHDKTYEFLENGTVLIGERKIKGTYQANAEKIKINGQIFNILTLNNDHLIYGRKTFTGSMNITGERI
ncbi:hypothetical protein [Marivirga sp.]|uniref:toxin-antitoxin system YwqK family antitoxin n=1 Tax=Marivirga sp. TaxID=2018662 RepID=UPI002D7FD0B5|nr:hypothetical protein [Marivirga sp.]HET8861051.1 hypothetical protein [Marivirga sp.]